MATVVIFRLVIRYEREKQEKKKKKGARKWHGPARGSPRFDVRACSVANRFVAVRSHAGHPDTCTSSIYYTDSFVSIKINGHTRSVIR